MHTAYSPVGYTYSADQYCLDCTVIEVRRAFKLNGNAGRRPSACNCPECVLDRLARTVGVDRYDEGSYDSGHFPKSIPYHNDLHCECGPEGYGYGPGDPEWQLEYCNSRCGECHEVIDGVSKIGASDVCPAYDNREDLVS